MNAKAIARLGIPGSLVARAGVMVGEARRAGVAADDVRRILTGIVAAPETFVADPHFGPLAAALAELRATESAATA